MADTITQGASTIAATRVLGYESARESKTVIHEILGGSIPDATLRPALKRSGRLEIGFQGATSESTSKWAADLLSNGTAAYVLASTDRTSINMTFVVTGAVSRVLEDQSRDAWVVAFDYQETT